MTIRTDFGTRGAPAGVSSEENFPAERDVLGTLSDRFRAIVVRNLRLEGIEGLSEKSTIAPGAVIEALSQAHTVRCTVQSPTRASIDFSSDAGTAHTLTMTVANASNCVTAPVYVQYEALPHCVGRQLQGPRDIIPVLDALEERLAGDDDLVIFLARFRDIVNAYGDFATVLEDATSSDARLLEAEEALFDRVRAVNAQSSEVEVRVRQAYCDRYGVYQLHSGLDRDLHVRIPSEFSSYRHIHVDKHIIGWMGDRPIADLFSGLLLGGFTPLTLAEAKWMKVANGSTTVISVMPAMQDDGRVDPAHVVIRSAVLGKDKVELVTKKIPLPRDTTKIPGSPPQIEEVLGQGNRHYIWPVSSAS